MWLDDERNFILVNHNEHISRKFDTLGWRQRFYGIQVARYGQRAMDDWIAGLPDKLKHRIDFTKG